MSLCTKTIFPKFPEEITKEYLSKLYTPSSEEIELSKDKTMSDTNQLFFLGMMMIFQRLGYFVSLSESPREILAHIASCVHTNLPNHNYIVDFDFSRQRYRYIQHIKQELKISNFSQKKCVELACIVAETKSFLIDIINGTIEQLLHIKMELPQYETLESICIKARKNVNEEIYHRIYDRLTSKKQQQILDEVLIYLPKKQTGWGKLKEEPTNISTKNIKSHIDHVKWIKKLQIKPSVFDGIADMKIESLYEEALKQDFSRIVRLSVKRKVAVTAIVIKKSTQQYMDDMVDVFIKIINSLESSAKNDFEEYKKKRIDGASYLVGKLDKVVTLYKSKTSKKERQSKIDHLIGDEVDNLAEMCADFNAYEKLGHLYFLGKRYRKSHAFYSSFLKLISPKSATSATEVLSQKNEVCYTT